MLAGYHFSATCGHCGGELIHCNGTEHNGTESVAIASCAVCRREWYITVVLRPMARYKTDLDYKNERALVAAS